MAACRHVGGGEGALKAGEAGCGETKQGHGLKGWGVASPDP